MIYGLYGPLSTYLISSMVAFATAWIASVGFTDFFRKLLSYWFYIFLRYPRLLLLHILDISVLTPCARINYLL